MSAVKLYGALGWHLARAKCRLWPTQEVHFLGPAVNKQALQSSDIQSLMRQTFSPASVVFKLCCTKDADQEGRAGPRASPGPGPGAQGARREAERAEAEASIMAGGLDEQHAAALEAADARRRAPAAGATEPLAMPDGTTMLVKHGSGGRVQARAARAPKRPGASLVSCLGELAGTTARYGCCGGVVRLGCQLRALLALDSL